LEESKVQIDRGKSASIKRGRLICTTIVILITVAVTAIFGISGYVGWNLTHPVRENIDSSPGALGLSYEAVTFASRVDGFCLKGWLIKAPNNRQTIIFAHGYGKNRLQEDVPLLPIVQALVNKGYNVLMFDFRNSGESAGKLTSLGQYEVRDLLGAVDFVRSRQDLSQKIVLFGFSMGAAVAIMAGAQELTVAAVIADSPFADLKSYLTENLSLWTNLPPRPFNQTVLITTSLLTGINVDGVCPLKEIKNLGGRPLLLIHGEADTDIPVENSKLLQKEYPRANLVLIPGAKHVQAFKTDGKRYLREVISFLEKL